jgi:hypothetical protein
MVVAGDPLVVPPVAGRTSRLDHLSRGGCPRYRPGLLLLQDHYSHPSTLYDAIPGGGIRQDSPGRLDALLRHNPRERSAYDACGVRS